MEIHWRYKGVEVKDVEQIPEGVFGFVYKITDLTNNKIYIGKKALYSRRKRKFGKKELSKITDKRKKTYEYVTKIIPKWEEYISSCEPLKEAIKDGARYSKEILHFCYSKQELSYFEVKYQMIEGVIEPGNNSYNQNVSGKFYPKLFVNR